MDAQLTKLLEAAIKAPSGDNTQPWRFEVDSQARRIAFYVDESRDPSPMNAGQRMSRIAIGAALENVLYFAEKYGWELELGEATPPALAAVCLRNAPAGETPQEDPVIAARVTNRRVYDGSPLPDEIWKSLEEQTPPLEGVRTHWIQDRERIRALAALVGRADGIMLGNPQMRKAFLANVRFDAPPDAEVDEGLSIASLELSPTDRRALKLMSGAPNWMLKMLGAPRFFAGHARKLIESASGLCLIVAPDSAPQADILVGRAMERAWLALAEKRLAVQPMSSLVVLENVVENGSPELFKSLRPQRLVELRNEFRHLTPEMGVYRPAFIMRFGTAPLPTGRTGRLPTDTAVNSSRSTAYQSEDASRAHG